MEADITFRGGQEEADAILRACQEEAYVEEEEEEEPWTALPQAGSSVGSEGLASPRSFSSPRSRLHRGSPGQQSTGSMRDLMHQRLFGSTASEASAASPGSPGFPSPGAQSRRRPDPEVFKRLNEPKKEWNYKEPAFTFHPEISEASRQKAEAAAANIAGGAGPRWKTLSQKDLVQQELLMQQRRKKEEAEKEECPFRPTISDHSKELVKQGSASGKMKRWNTKELPPSSSSLDDGPLSPGFGQGRARLQPSDHAFGSACLGKESERYPEVNLSDPIFVELDRLLMSLVL